MSDSAEDKASQLTTTSTDHSLPADLPLSPEEAERFASAYVPAWQVDGALASGGAEWARGQREELGAAPGTDPDSIFVDSLAPVVETRVPSAPPRGEPASVKTDLQPLLPEDPSRAAASAPLIAGPMRSRLTTLDEAGLSSKRSHGRAWFAVGGVAAVLAIVAAVLLTKERESPAAASAAVTMPPSPPQAAEESRIPPPPPAAEIPPPPEAAVTPTRVAVSPSMPNPPARRASNAPPSHRSDTAHTLRDPLPATKSFTKGNGGSIVRDNPY